MKDINENRYHMNYNMNYILEISWIVSLVWLKSIQIIVVAITL